jgi:hypothetical protein
MLMGSLKPAADAVALLPEPPEIATFMLRASKSHRGSLSSRPLVACADKGLLVLYVGNYFGPGSSRCGCYLIHDAGADPSASLLSTVPPPPDARDRTKGIGSGAVVLRCHHPGPSSSAYLLAELATMPHRRFPDPDAALLLWRSDEQPTPPQWVRKEVHLPREVCWTPDRHLFQGDTSFAGPGGCLACLCWVDLLHGIVVCTKPPTRTRTLRCSASSPCPTGAPRSAGQTTGTARAWRSAVPPPASAAASRSSPW